MSVRSNLAVYAGSFDPLTLGHLDVIERGVDVFHELVVAVGVHPTRAPLFDRDERVALLSESTVQFSNLKVSSFEGLLTDFCKSIGARVVIRGLRHSMDFVYELQIAQANADMAPDIVTVFMPTSSQVGFITASLVREIASHGGDVSRYAPDAVCSALQKKFDRR
ncbi:MAG: pantetheine-phosphate adenylyltransferase [Deltaproteobacteria bacterium]|nr:pantetheine-phosphate adenylyltransferase [Deltaproteobacteria bacterium]